MGNWVWWWRWSLGLCGVDVVEVQIGALCVLVGLVFNVC